MSPAATSTARWKIPFIQETIISSSCRPPPFIGITETWLKSYITDAQVSLKGYQVFRSDRPGRVGGGCLLYVNEQLVVTDSSHYEDRQCNLVTCYVKSSHTLIAAVYRPPDSSQSSFSALLDALQEKVDCFSENAVSPDIFILGDFNFPELDWKLQDDANSPSSIDLLQFVDRNLLTQIVDKPTRRGNTLDLILTNVPRYISELRVSTTTLSDHDLVEALLGYDMLQPKDETSPVIDPHSFRAVDYHRADFDAMQQEFADFDWAELWLACDGDKDSYLERIKLTVLEVTLKHSPKKVTTSTTTSKPKQGRKKNRLTCVMKRRKRKLNARIRALEQVNPQSPTLRKLKDEVNLLAYEIQQTILQTLNQREERAVAAIKENPKYFFSYAKRLQKTRSSIPLLRDSDGILTDDSSKKAEILQDQYRKVFSDPAQADLEACLDSCGLPQGSPKAFNSFSFTEEEISAALKELDPYSAGPDDDIPAKILKMCRDQLAIPLYIYWDESLTTGHISADLKTQYIAPIYKKGDRTTPANYRPISLTSHIIKTFERVLRNRLVDHLESNNLINPNQHGFRKKRSCFTQLLSHIENIYGRLNNNEEVDVIYLDYAKAFDKLDHNILFAKLKRYGIGGQVLGWIKAFLTQRYQTVVVEGHRSRPQLVISGVPQGTVLGPILFLLYINDLLPTLRNSDGFSFADDTKLLASILGLDCTKRLQEDLNRVVEWSRVNNMELHEEKFEVLSYSLTRCHTLRQLPFYPDSPEYKTPKGHTITPADTVRDLGVYVSSNRSWSPHVEAIAQSARKMASWVLSAFRDRSPNTMLTLYKTMVRSRLEYCCPLWNPSKISDIQKLENIQRSFLRKIVGCGQIDYWDRLKKLRLMSLQRRRERYCIIQVWKILHSEAPNDIKMQFKTLDRHGVKVILPSVNNKTMTSVRSDYDHSFSVRAAQLWNTLPADVTLLDSLDPFKAGLGKFLEQYPDNPPVPGYATLHDNSLHSWRWTPMRQLA